MTKFHFPAFVIRNSTFVILKVSPNLHAQHAQQAITIGSHAAFPYVALDARGLEARLSIFSLATIRKGL